MPRSTPFKANDLSTTLAMQIVAMVRHNDLPVGSHLTEQTIVDAFNVSRSPVRKAMSLLADLGILRSEKNRGYFLQKNGRALDRLAASSPPANGDAFYLQVADDRLRGSLGAHVTEAEIMRRYDVTRVQAQQVLHRMAGESLIVRKPGRGWMFQPILDTEEAHNQSYRFRMIIEPAAVLEPTFEVNADAFARVRREQQAMLSGDMMRVSRARVFQIGAAFHETIVACSGNQFLLDAIRRQNQLRRLIEYKGNVDRSRLVKQCQEHLKLLELLESGDRKAAAAFLRRHLDVVRSIKTRIDVPAAARAGERLHVQL
jgi:DNA-binding GntR family transcriptional regulator